MPTPANRASAPGRCGAETAGEDQAQPRRQGKRLIELVRRAAVVPKPRVKTKPSRAVKARRLDAKTQRGRLKQTRQKRPETE